MHAKRTTLAQLLVLFGIPAGSPVVISLTPALVSFDLFRYLVSLALAHSLITYTDIKGRACIPPKGARSIHSTQHPDIL